MAETMPPKITLHTGKVDFADRAALLRLAVGFVPRVRKREPTEAEVQAAARALIEHSPRHWTKVH